MPVSQRKTLGLAKKAGPIPRKSSMPQSQDCNGLLPETLLILVLCRWLWYKKFLSEIRRVIEYHLQLCVMVIYGF